MSTMRDEFEALLPEPAEYACIGGVAQNIYTAEQMRAMFDAATERAAKQCDEQAEFHQDMHNTQAEQAADACAAAIRAKGGEAK